MKKGIRCNETRFTNGEDRDRIRYEFLSDDGNTPSSCTVRLGDIDSLTGEPVTDVTFFREYYRLVDHQVHKNLQAARRDSTQEQKVRCERERKAYTEAFCQQLTLKRSSEATEKLKELLVPFGFERSDLKTLSFGVDTEYASYKEKNEYKRRFDGYKFRHVVKVEFESDNKRLGKILYELAHCSLNPEFRLSYTVKDPEAVKNELLGKAVRDAVAKRVC